MTVKNTPVPDLPLRLISYASSYEVGSVIMHIFQDRSEKPIAYGSRTFSSAEIKYSQIKKEGLCIIFGLNKFNQYLYGRKFTLVTDHKPFISILYPKKVYHNFQRIGCVEGQ